MIRIKHVENYVVKGIIFCPACKEQHVDEGRWRWKLHTTHLCSFCGHEWQEKSGKFAYSIGVHEWENNLEEGFGKWDVRFLQMCDLVSEWSKDPSTKNGAVLVDSQRNVLGTGYNGYPRGVKDVNYHDREYKYDRIVHSEVNAILSSRVVLRGMGTTLYTGLFPCTECTKVIIQSGVEGVVSRWSDNDRWRDSQAISREMLSQSGIEVRLVTDPGRYHHG